MKKLLSTLVILNFVSNSFAQDADPANFQKMTDFLPPAPNAAAMIKYGEISINKNTGSPNISIPFFSLKGHKLSTSVSIGYSSTGLKVDEIASRVGMGWSLNAGGVITRTVRGWADENTTRIQPPTTLAANFALYDYCDKIINSTNNVGYDSEPDLYNFNMNGNSGSFVLDNNMNPVLIPADKFKVIIHQRTTSENYDFIIIDKVGIKYYFGGSTATEKTKRDNSCGKTYDQYFPNAWYLIRIEHPNGEVIKFVYSALTYTYDGGVSETRYAKTSLIINSNISGSGGPIGFSCNCCSSGECPDAPQPSECVNSVSTQGVLLESIQDSSSGSTIELYYQSRTDCTDKLLSQVKFYNKQQLTGAFSLGYEQVQSSSAYTNKTFSGHNKTPYLIYIHEQSSTLGTGRKHLFEYDHPETRAPRLSYSQDHWGYFNGKVNATMIPPPTDDQTKHFFPTATANREPDPNFASIGMLRKIVYPTGGVTILDYESNEMSGAESYTNPYEYNCSVTGTGVWEEVSKSTNFTIGPTREIKIIITTTYTGHGDCSTQHNKGTIEIKNSSNTVIFTKSTYSTGTVETEYIDGFNLPAGQYLLTYKAAGECMNLAVKMIYYPRTITSSKLNKTVGGVRVKRIITGNPGEKPMIKRYYYAEMNDLEHSSLIAVQQPFYRKGIEKGIQCKVTYSNEVPWTGKCGLIAMSSSSLFNLFDYHNSSISYSSVIESNGEDFENGAIQSIFMVGNDLPSQQIWRSNEELPANNTPVAFNVPLSNFGSVLNGNLKEEIVFKKKSVSGGMFPIKKTEYEYMIDDRLNQTVYGYLVNLNYTPYHIFPIPGSSPTTPVDNQIADAYTIMKYHAVSQWAHLDYTTETVYDENGENPIISTTYSFFDNEDHMQLTRSESINSKGEQIVTLNTYPHEHAGTQPYDDMIAKNIITPLVTTESNNITKSIPISKAFIDYGDAGNGNYVPVALRKSVKAFDPYQEGTIDLYDQYGNILQFTGKNGIVTSIIWGYGRLYPVAQIVGATYANAIAELKVTLDELQSLDGTDLLDELNEIRSGLSKAMVTTYTYKKAGGIATITDPNNKKNTYEYDPFNRLEIIKDQDGNIVKRNEYAYASPNIESLPKIYFNEAVTQHIQCDCWYGYTGNYIDYVIPFGKYYSLVSQQDADDQVANDTYGQEYANRNGKCTNVIACSGEGYKVVDCACQLGQKIMDECTEVNQNGGWTNTYHYLWLDGSTSTTYTEVIASCSGSDKKKIGCVCETGTKVCDNVESNGAGSYDVTYHYHFSNNTNSSAISETIIGCSGPDKKMVGCNCETGLKTCYISESCSTATPPAGCCSGKLWLNHYRYHFSDNTFSSVFTECADQSCVQ